MTVENERVPEAVEKKEVDLEDLLPDKKKDTEKKKGRMAKYGGLIALSLIVVVFVLLALANINLGQWFADVALGYYNSFGEMGIYLGIFILTLVGNATVIFPVPYTVVIIVISAVLSPVAPWYFPLVVGLYAGAGASVGETSAWFVGRGAREWAKFKESEKVARMKRWVDKGLAPLMIFIFAVTPLADDPFLMVLGFIGYALWRAIMWCFLGKWLMCFIVSGLTMWASTMAWGKWLIKLFGIDIDALRVSIETGHPVVPAGTETLVTSTIVWILTFAVVISLIYVDWDKVFAKLKSWNTKKKPELYPPATPNPEVTVQNEKATEVKSTKDGNGNLPI